MRRKNQKITKQKDFWREAQNLREKRGRDWT